ncbi:flavodoxin family protein [Clostridium hydrogenum]|uniref:flavodoxin family protein n=1 Tax=Clostridium hydrogenum TaxID=2855764 RepID=UPI001F2D3459|nr:flavodoxin family protein [Clostridium hydrogenum]
MGVVIISGSPRKNGNTELLLSILNIELKKNNINTEFISLSGKKINHCINCDKCIGINKCIQNDDFNSIYSKVLENKGLVIGSPVYVGMPTSLLMAFIQRLTYVSYNNNHTLSKKIGGPIAVGGESGQLTTINSLVDFYLVNEMLIPGSNYWNIGVGINKGDIKKDEKGKAYIMSFAQNLSSTMKIMEEKVI